MHLFFLIQSHLLLIFCMDDQEFEANLDYVLFMFSPVTSSKVLYIILLKIVKNVNTDQIFDNILHFLFFALYKNAIIK